MKKLATALLYLAMPLAFLGVGLWLGPSLHDLYARLFPAPAFVRGDFGDLYRETGKPVVMFSTSTCPHCRSARDLLAHERVDYHDFVIDESAGAERRFKTLHGEGVPLLFIGDRRITGFQESTIRDALAALKAAARAPN